MFWRWGAEQIAITLVAVGILGLAIVYSAVAQPILDDWCFAVTPGSPVDRANALYQSWSGRWPTMFTIALLLRGQAIASPEYALFAAGGLVVWFAGFLVVADRILDHWREKLLAAALMLATFWAAASGTGESFYWVSSYINYGMAFLFGAACLSIATRHLTGRRIAIASLCGFVSAMFSELGGICVLVAISALCIERWLAGKRLGPALCVLITAALGALVVVASPGNAAREAIQPTMAWPKIAWSVVRPYEGPLSIMADPCILALVAAILVLPNPDRRIPDRWWLIPTAAVGAVFASILAFVIATGTTPTYRVLSFLQAGVLSAFAVTAWHLRGLIPSARIAVHWIFAAVLVTAPAVGAGLHDLPMAFGEWRPAHQSRWALLRASEGRDVALPDYSHYPSIYPDRDLSADPNNPINRCIAGYFGAASVRAVGPDGKRWRTAY